MAGNSVKIDAGQLSAKIHEILDEYGEQGTMAVKKAGRKTTRQAAKDVNSNASSLIHGRRGKYEKSWTSKFVETRTSFAGVVYSKEPGLAHLLEHGHRITYLGGNRNKGPGHARAIPHIAKVDDQVPDEFEKNIRVEINKL